MTGSNGCASESDRHSSNFKDGGGSEFGRKEIMRATGHSNPDPLTVQTLGGISGPNRSKVSLGTKAGAPERLKQYTSPNGIPRQWKSLGTYRISNSHSHLTVACSKPSSINAVLPPIDSVMLYLNREAFFSSKVPAIRYPKGVEARQQQLKYEAEIAMSILCNDTNQPLIKSISREVAQRVIKMDPEIFNAFRCEVNKDVNCAN
nr:hypothetical protein [Endozoicomonas sp.]